MDKQLVSIDVLREKYANGDSSVTEDHIYQRVAKGISKAENTDPMRKHWESIFYTNMKNGAIGAGRIMSAAGTDMQATLINCFIQPVADSVLDYDEDGNPGIYTALAQAAETMRRGGGVGYNFSKIRPYGAFVKSTHSFASGPCSFINIFDVSCSTVEAAGFRRGAQLAALNIDHPDIEKFIVAKREKGKWNNFNISVLVTDEFMKAKTNDEDWELIHKAKPSQSLIDAGAFQRNDGLWVYKTVKAKYLWDIIMKSNYDFAEPGILFENNINNDNNLRDIEYIDTTNPCVTGDSWIHTSKGPRQVKDLIDKPIEVFVNGKLYKSENGFFSTGNKPVFRLNTIEGYNVKLTENHLVLVNRNNEPSVIRNWIEAKDIRLGDKIVLHNHELNEWDSHGTYDEGYLLGVFIGDGHYSGEDNSAFISAYKKGNPDGLMKAFLDSSKILNLRSDHKGWNEHINSVGETKYIFKSTDLKKLSTVYGLFPNKVIESNIETASFNFYKGFLKGFFDTDGTVAINNNIITSLRYSQSDLNRLYAVQRMLARLGIMSKLYKERRVESYRLLPDGNGGKKEYLCKAQHELVISKDNITRFLNIIGTNDTSHLNRIKQNTIKNNKFYKEEYMARFLNLTPIGEQEVYDIQVPGINAFDCDGAYLHNCGEEPLPAYGCCNLGPVILPKFVKDPFTDYAKFDYEALRDAVEIHVRFLDNVLDVTLWPLIEQKQQADDKRRIGIGFTGLANALAMLGLKYNSKKGIEEARSIVEIMRNSAYTASSNLAAEKGSFPKFNVEQYLNEGTFASRLPDKIKELIKEQGIRNSHLLSVAPTGTVSLAFADNASNGIEPPFSLAYTRKKRNSDGTHTFYNVLDHGLRIFLNTLEKEFANDLLEAIIGYKESFNYKGFEFNVKECLPKSIVTAMELSVDDHLNMMAAIQPYIDSSISKCVVKGTRIITNKGLMKIEDLGCANIPDTFNKCIEGLEVLTPDGTYKKVKEHYYGGIKNTVKIRLSNGQTIEGSTEHKLMTINGWVKMSELNIDDCIYVKRNISYNNEGGNVLPPIHYANGVKYNSITNMSVELALFLGMMAADGHLMESSGLVSLTKNDYEVGNKFTELVKSLFGANVKHIIDSRNGVNSWCFHSTAICRWIEKLIGYRSYNKHVPEEIMQGSPDEMKAFISGVSLDGYKTSVGLYEATILYDGRSELLAKDIFSMLVALNYKPRLGKKYVKDYDYLVYNVRSANIDFTIQPYKRTIKTDNEYVLIPNNIINSKNSSTSIQYYFLRTVKNRDTKFAKERQLKCNFPDLYKESDTIVYKITNIEYGNNEVYDIEVENTHDYLIDGIISHNTVNVPVDYPFDDFKLMYDKAYTSKLKGVAAYRPNDTLGSVLSVGGETPKLKEPIKKENNDSIDHLNSIIERRKEVELEAITKKVSYIGPDGKESFYLIVSFIDVELEYAGNKLKVLRPIEVFIAAHPDGVPREWIDIYARNLALLARSGLNTLCKALNDSRKVKSDKGLIRYGHYTKQDGAKVPRYHDSSVACIAYAVQEILTSKNIINENGNPYTVKELFDNNEDLKTLADSIIDDDIVIDNNINTENTSIIHGKKCNECGADAVIKKDGCLFCTSCGNIGTCG